MRSTSIFGWREPRRSHFPIKIHFAYFSVNLFVSFHSPFGFRCSAQHCMMACGMSEWVCFGCVECVGDDWKRNELVTEFRNHAESMKGKDSVLPSDRRDWRSRMCVGWPSIISCVAFESGSVEFLERIHSIFSFFVSLPERQKIRQMCRYNGRPNPNS